MTIGSYLVYCLLQWNRTTYPDILPAVDSKGVPAPDELGVYVREPHVLDNNVTAAS